MNTGCDLHQSRSNGISISTLKSASHLCWCTLKYLIWSSSGICPSEWPFEELRRLSTCVKAGNQKQRNPLSCSSKWVRVLLNVTKKLPQTRTQDALRRQEQGETESEQTPASRSLIISTSLRVVLHR